jgi:hypothetical protein
MGSYLGRYRQGDDADLRLVLPQWPDAAPTADVIRDGELVASVGLAAGPEPGTFHLPLRLGADYGPGMYTVAYGFTLEGQAQLDIDRFEVVPGGDVAGRVIALHAYHRPEARFLVAQVASGRLLYGRDPTA